MFRVKIILFSFLTIFLAGSAYAGNDSQKELKDYFSKVSRQVKQSNDPAQKRAILNKSFDDLLKAFNTAGEMPLSQHDRDGIDYFKQKVLDKKYELNGTNGYDKVADASLNQFADYSMQQFEQSAEYITISVVALILIIIVVALLL